MFKRSALVLTVFAAIGQTHAQGTGLRVPMLESPMLREVNAPQDDIITITDSETFDVTDDTNKFILQGGAQVRRSDVILKGDRITYDRELGKMRAEGHARLYQEGNLFTGEEIEYNVDSENGEFLGPIYSFADGSSGKADFADMLDRNHLRLFNATFASCPCPDPSWYLAAERVDLYDDENEGIARNAKVYVGDIPVFWSPYFTFPLRQEKKTGFLTPTFSYSSRSGADIIAPYFINLAPNYDATLTPRWLSKRGLMLGGEFRYLQPNYSGQITGAYLPKDKNFNDQKRWTYGIIHRQQLGSLLGFNFGFNFNWNKASDGNYFRDLDDLEINEADRTYLNQSATLTFSGHRFWSGFLRWDQYQGLHDLALNSESDAPGAGVYRQYERKPELLIRGARYDWGGFDVSTVNTLTRFEFPKYPAYLRGGESAWLDHNGHTEPNGTRFISYSTLSYPIVRPGWYITPKVGLHFSHYETDWYKGRPGGGFFAQDNSQKRSQSRTLPIFSIDSGMTFERDTTFFGKASKQTLEPRLYYLYIPFREQSGIPVYDTSVSQFGFGTAFTENRYSGGWDRINNANRLTFGLTTRWLDAHSGLERLALQVAQSFSFQPQKVTLSNNEQLANNRSEFLASLSARLTDKLNTEAAIQYDPYEKKIAQSSVSVRWNPKRLTSLSLSYRYQREPLLSPEGYGYSYQLSSKENVIVAGQWPITEKINAVGRLDYSIKESRSTQSIAGIEYRSNCCWSARVLFQRYAVAREKTNSRVFFQLELSGLGALGSDPMKTIRENIPGYEPTEVPVPVRSTFERYE
ncbi:LPS-assembly protein LptD [Oligella sp. MSHR50489EDL]|uniref:LPS-assembly protein LptD n=1 Tax=Oligella sp. MSHR50489EDL TaxID=3139409 RepID=UPI003D817323